MTADDIVTMLDTTKDRAELLALLAPMRLPHGLPETEQAKVTDAVVRAASRCWRGRVSG
jgi:hypothetical protein